jgi:RND family efflux transporter MFP subunit
MNTKEINTEKKSGTFNRWLLIFAGFILIGAGGIWLLKTCQSQAAETDNKNPQDRQIPVVVTNPVRRTFRQVIAIQGNIEAKYVALVSPRIPGTIDEFFVDEGDKVTADETKLFQTDSVKLQQNVTIREHDLAVAICADKQAQASLEKVTADFEKAELDFKRFERLLKQNATTQDIFEKQQSEYKQLAASVKVAQAQVELSTEHIRQAEAALAIAKKDLDDSTIVSPIDGVIAMRMAEPGETGSPGIPVLRIEDTNIVEVSAYLPAVIYPSVVTGKTTMQIKVSGIDIGNHIISYKSPTIQAKLRTFEVKCLLENPPESVAPGAMAEIEIILNSHEGIGAPVSSIQKRSNQSVIFVIEGNTARMKTVQTGLEYEGWTEILNSNITESSSVVSMGQDMLDEGKTVSIQNEAN